MFWWKNIICRTGLSIESSDLHLFSPVLWELPPRNKVELIIKTQTRDNVTEMPQLERAPYHLK